MLKTSFLSTCTVIFIISILILSFSVWAEENNNQYTEEIIEKLIAKFGPDNIAKIRELIEDPGLGHYLSIEEMLKPPLDHDDYIKTPPPEGAISSIAEFEPSEGVLIRYPFGIPYSLIRELSEYVKVITLVSSTSQQNTVISLYTSNGVNLDNCEFAIYSTDSYWTRDYGPWFIRDGNSHISIVDFTYNRPRPNDNQIPYKMSQYLGVPYYNMSIYHTGGNYMSDGNGIAGSTDLVYEENPGLTPAQVNQAMENYLGIHTYHAVPDPNNTYIDHIDCWAKYLAPDKILIRRVPESHSQYDEIEDSVNYFMSQISSYGTRYKIYRVDTPQNQPYTNSLIMNNKVFVPMMGQTYYDNLAIAVYEEAMPGYEIVGITGSWQSTDALHCRTKEIADRGMLYIDHIPLLPVQPAGFAYEITAGIIPYSGQALYDDELKVYYRFDEEVSYSFVLMEESGENTYTAEIMTDGTPQKISYYISAADASGRNENHPYIGGADPHVFNTVPSDIVSPVFPVDNQEGVSAGLHYLAWHYIPDHIEIEGFYIYISESPDFGENTYTAFIPYEESIDDIYYHDTDGFDFERNSYYYWKINPATCAMEVMFTPQWSFATYSYPPPSNLQASGIFDDRIELSWDIPVKELLLSGCNVYRSSTLDGEYIKVNPEPVAGNIYTDWDVNCPEVFYYLVKALYSDGLESGPSNIAMGMTDPVIYYQVNLFSDPDYIGIILEGAGYYPENSTVSISADLPKNYTFLSWTGDHIHLLDDPYSGHTFFTMPDHDLAFTAVFEEPADGIQALMSLENPEYTGIWLWSYNSGTSEWSMVLSGQTSDKVMAGDISGDGDLEVIANFPDYGLWYYSISDNKWTNILPNSIECRDFTLARTETSGPVKLVVSFSGFGLYIWEYSKNEKSAWTRLIDADADILASADINRNPDGLDELIISFSNYPGMYIYDFTLQAFNRIVTVSPSQITADDITGDGYEEIICSFDGFGIYMARYIPDKGPVSVNHDSLYHEFDLLSDIPKNRTWFSRHSDNKGLQLNRLTFAVPDQDHYMGTGDISGGLGSEVIMTYNGSTYVYSYDTQSWSTMVHAPLKRIISGKFTNSAKDDLIVCESSTGSIFLKNAVSGYWELLLESGNTSAMAPLKP